MSATEVQSTRLSSAIERLYDVFASYPLRAQIDGCPHCVHPAMEEPLHARPLRELTGEELSLFSGKAMTTWGDDIDFRHFLPRLLELVALGDSDIDSFFVMGKLAYGKWELWPGEEQQAVRDFLLAWWADVLEKSPDEVDADCCLNDIEQAESTVMPYLNVWRTNHHLTATLQLARFVSVHRSDGTTGEVLGERLVGRSREITAFLFEPEVGRRLAACGLGSPDADWAEEVIEAAQTLQLVSAAGSPK